LARQTNGQIPIGSTGAAPVLGTISAGTGISITNGAGSITVAVTGSISSHALLDGSVNNDTVAHPPVRGDLIVGNSTPAWARFALGANHTVLKSNGTDPAWAAVDLTADVTGTLPVGSGGTGLATGTSGGILGFTGSTTLISSGVLAATALMLGGGAGATPSTDSDWTINAQHTLNSSSQPRAIAFNSAVQSIADSTFTALTLDSKT
jgi:hypothetical protein